MTITEIRWDIPNQIMSWALMIVGLICMAGFIVVAARIGLGHYHGHNEVVTRLTMPIIAWGLATAAVALAWSLL